MNNKFNEVSEDIFEHGLDSMAGIESCEAPFLDGEGFE